uniref:Uncharacterized protein n=1 Tax=Rhizophora mucronata TaxID=61149 RepID=A0A2P2QKW7_RHIMU
MCKLFLYFLKPNKIILDLAHSHKQKESSHMKVNAIIGIAMFSC